MADKKPVRPMTLDDLGKALRKWAQSLTPEEKAAVRNHLLAGVKS